MASFIMISNVKGGGVLKGKISMQYEHVEPPMDVRSPRGMVGQRRIH